MMFSRQSGRVPHEANRNRSVRPPARTVLLTSPDLQFRSRLRHHLAGMRWQIREAGGGAEAIEMLEQEGSEAMVLDSVLPDLEVCEFASEVRQRHPVMDLVWVNTRDEDGAPKSPRRNELMYAVRKVQEEMVSNEYMDGNAKVSQPACSEVCDLHADGSEQQASPSVWGDCSPELNVSRVAETVEAPKSTTRVQPLPDMVGDTAEMVELARMVRLVARRSTAVLIQGETGTGKELVAKAVHTLSTRATRPFVVLNCAAIPESLLEAELFGHTRGAFTGAVQSRQGRIEAADGGTLFLDEIGEMPLPLQAKMLRFLECGELQRVGDNQPVRVNVRVVAASHQPLKERASAGLFRLDLYHRLAVFPVRLPPLRERMQDLPALSAYLLDRLGQEMPVKRLSNSAAAKLQTYDWPGNVRELAHVLERAVILAEDRRELAAEEIRF